MRAALRYLKRAETTVLDGIARAVDLRNGSYRVGYRCDDCDGLDPTEVADPWTLAAVLPDSGDAAQSHISVKLPDGRHLLLLLLAGNTAPPPTLPEPPPALALVRRVREPGDAAELGRMFIGEPHPATRLSLPDCRLCAAAQRYSSLVDKAQQWAEKLWRSESETITPWADDREGRPMYSRVRQRVFSAALIIAQLGFKQSKNKPWLFVHAKTPLKAVFVDFGASENRVLWNDASARVYSAMRFEPANEQMLETLGRAEEVLAVRLRDLGANVKSRVNEKVDEIESFRGVDFDTLNKLVESVDDEHRPGRFGS